MSLVALRNVSFAYDGTPVLVDVDLTIEEGDFLAIIGPNGSGKTTLVKIILGLLPPSSGEVEIFGKRPGRVHATGRRSATSPRRPPTSIRSSRPRSRRSSGWPSWPAAGQGRLSGREGRAKVRRALEVVGMAEFGKEPIGRLSGGQQQRVFIARALVTRPGSSSSTSRRRGSTPRRRTAFYDLLDRLNQQRGPDHRPRHP